MPTRIPVQTCVFCEKPCGNDARTCAENNGGRKALKTAIRALVNAEGGAAPSTRLEELYKLYEKVSVALALDDCAWL